MSRPVTRWPLREWLSHQAFEARQQVDVPELGEHRALERPVLERLLEMPGGRRPLRVKVVHPKSKRPKFLPDEAGNPTEDRDAPGGGP
jgi:hypothetical protein